MTDALPTDPVVRRARWFRLRGARAARRGPVSVTRAVVQFGLASLVAVLVIGLAGVEVLKSEGDREAFKDAKQLATLAGRGIVQPLVSDALFTGNATELARVDRVVRTSVLGHGIARVKIWTAQGRIVYSDASPLIGAVYPLPADEVGALRSGAVVAEPSTDPVRPENRFERSFGPLVDIYLPIHTSSGRALLFEAYLPSHEVSASARHRWEAFAPALFGGLVLLALVQLPLAWSLASRLRRGQQEREALLVRAIEASEDERRRIAADLHDGVVQDLAGVAYSLSASAETVGSQQTEALAGSLRVSASQTRQSIRSLRTLLVDIYPANLRSVGLEAALSDLVSALSARGKVAQLTYQPDLEISDDLAALLYRIAQEAIRNVMAHARARHVEVIVAADAETVSLTVRDDGIGFSPDTANRRASARPPRPEPAGRPRARAPGAVRDQLRARPRHRRSRGGGTDVIRVLIVDDHLVVRTGLEQLLESADDITVVAAVGEGERAAELAAEHLPDVVLMDLSMPGIGGAEATRRIRACAPTVNVVVLTSFSDRERILEALDAGALGYLLKDIEPDELMRGIHAAARGESPLAPKAALALITERSGPPQGQALTRREREVLSLVGRGLPNKLIARELSISEKTVKAHLTRAFQRIGVSDRTQAALWAHRHQI